MLRAQAFEGLFTLVPILLVAVISIFLRARAVKRRKQREEAAQGAPARGAPARGAPAQDARGTQYSAGTRTAASGQEARGAPRVPGRPLPSKREGAATRAPQFPWQRETVDTTPASAAPFTPQQPRRPQTTTRESFAYPPALSLNDIKSAAAAATQSQVTRVLRPVIRPSAESRMAVLPDGINLEAQNLRERMEAREKSIQPAAKAAAVERASISARLEGLPPLKRAVIWAEILGPPGGRQ